MAFAGGTPGSGTGVDLHRGARRGLRRIAGPGHAARARWHDGCSTPRHRLAARRTTPRRCDRRSAMNTSLFQPAFRNRVPVLRSGVVGRKSLGSMPRRLVRRWFERRDEDALLQASVGASPSLADVIKLAHPRPADAERAALYAWILGRPCDRRSLPAK